MVQRRKQDTPRRLLASEDIRKLGIVTINFRRPTILRLWIASIERLRRDCGDFPAVCVSEKDDEAICQRHNITHITMINNPISSKWNAGFRFMRDQDVDYVVVLGSDDIMSSHYLSNAMEAMTHNPDVVYTKSIYFYDGEKKGHVYKYSDARELGVGRCIHRDVLDQINWIPYPQHLTFGLDGALRKRIMPYVKTKIEIEGVIVDVKTKMNMNSIRVWQNKGIICSPAVFIDYLSDREKELLERIKK